MPTKKTTTTKKMTTTKQPTKAKKPMTKNTQPTNKTNNVSSQKISATQNPVTTSKATVQKKIPVQATDSTATVGSALGFKPYQQKKTEEYMSPKMREHFEEILLFWKRQLMEEVDSTVVHMQEEAANFPDPVDRAALEEGFNLELRTRDRERKLIRKIEKSLTEIQEGEYGFCEDCGVEIGTRRLEARPTAAKCIDCKTYQEIREKQEGAS